MNYKRIVAEQEYVRKYNKDREDRIFKLAEENQGLRRENFQLKEKVNNMVDKLIMINEKLTEITNRIEGH